MCLFFPTPGIKRGRFLPSPLMPLLGSVKKGKPYNTELTTIDTSTAKNAFTIFHFISLNHRFNGKAHWAIIDACMTVVAFLWFGSYLQGRPS